MLSPSSDSVMGPATKHTSVDNSPREIPRRLGSVSLLGRRPVRRVEAAAEPDLCETSAQRQRRQHSIGTEPVSAVQIEHGELWQLRQKGNVRCVPVEGEIESGGRGQLEEQWSNTRVTLHNSNVLPARRDGRLQKARELLGPHPPEGELTQMAQSRTDLFHLTVSYQRSASVDRFECEATQRTTRREKAQLDGRLLMER